MQQLKQAEWYDQWSLFQDEELFLFQDWISPSTLEDFKNKDVLECGCGGGQHTMFIAPFAKSIVAVDLNTVEIAKQRNRNSKNIQFIEADIACMNLGRKFDIVFSVGVVHHTDNPDRAVQNLKRHIKPGGRLILWVYSKEGNLLVERVIEPLRKVIFSKMNKRGLIFTSKIMTFCMYLLAYTIYLLPFKKLPYYDYLENFRKLSFYRNTLNIFDKLNAPQVDLISKERIAKWFDEQEFEEIHISSYKGVSWRGSGTKRVG